MNTYMKSFWRIEDDFVLRQRVTWKRALIEFSFYLPNESLKITIFSLKSYNWSLYIPAYFYPEMKGKHYAPLFNRSPRSLYAD